jgi:hypothetical protein
MYGTRRWWLLGGVLRGPLGKVYHYISKEEKETACGMVLPEAYGKFFDTYQSKKQQVQARCPKCVEARKAK